MANMNLTTAANVLKTFYLPPLRRLLNNQTIFWNRLEFFEIVLDFFGFFFFEFSWEFLWDFLMKYWGKYGSISAQ